MRRVCFALCLLVALGTGLHALYAAGAEPGPPCDIDPNIQCLDVVDPVICVKPGQGWRIYGNACYAWRDCALTQTCRPYPL